MVPAVVAALAVLPDGGAAVAVAGTLTWTCMRLPLRITLK